MVHIAVQVVWKKKMTFFQDRISKCMISHPADAVLWDTCDKPKVMAEQSYQEALVPSEEERFDSDDDATLGAKTPDYNFIPRKYLPPSSQQGRVIRI